MCAWVHSKLPLLRFPLLRAKPLPKKNTCQTDKNQDSLLQKRFLNAFGRAKNLCPWALAAPQTEPRNQEFLGQISGFLRLKIYSSRPFENAKSLESFGLCACARTPALDMEVVACFLTLSPLFIHQKPIYVLRVFTNHFPTSSKCTYALSIAALYLFEPKVTKNLFTPVRPFLGSVLIHTKQTPPITAFPYIQSNPSIILVCERGVRAREINRPRAHRNS